jgi:zinc protease
VPENELTYAKRALRGSYALDNETLAGQAGTLGYYAAIDRWQFAADYIARCEAVTAEQVQAVARKYLDNNRSVAVLLRPRPRGAPQPPARTSDLRRSVFDFRSGRSTSRRLVPLPGSVS